MNLCGWQENKKTWGKSWASLELSVIFLFLLQLTLDAGQQFKMDGAEFRVEISANPVAVDTTPQRAVQCQKARTPSAPPVDVWQFIQAPPGGFYGMELSSGAGSSTWPALYVTACREAWSEDVCQYTDCFLLRYLSLYSSIILTSFFSRLDILKQPLLHVFLQCPQP